MSSNPCPPGYIAVPTTFPPYYVCLPTQLSTGLVGVTRVYPPALVVYSKKIPAVYQTVVLEFDPVTNLVRIPSSLIERVGYGTPIEISANKALPILGKLLVKKFDELFPYGNITYSLVDTIFPPLYQTSYVLLESAKVPIIRRPVAIAGDQDVLARLVATGVVSSMSTQSARRKYTIVSTPVTFVATPDQMSSMIEGYVE